MLGIARVNDDDTPATVAVSATQSDSSHVKRV